jgi:ABC-type enterochelin transport system permease subunit
MKLSRLITGDSMQAKSITVEDVPDLGRLLTLFVIGFGLAIAALIVIALTRHDFAGYATAYGALFFIHLLFP